MNDTSEMMSQSSVSSFISGIGFDDMDFFVSAGDRTGHELQECQWVHIYDVLEESVPVLEWNWEEHSGEWTAIAVTKMKM